MPKNQSTAAKKARALANTDGIPYAEALSRVTAPAGPRTAVAHIAPSTDPMVKHWACALTLDGRTTAVHEDGDAIRRHLEWCGWNLVPGQYPADVLAAGEGDLHLIRNDHGILLDQQRDIWDAAGLDFNSSAEPYAAAVVAAIEASGIPVAEWDVQPDEDRRIYITLGADEGPEGFDVEDDDEDRRRSVLAWIDLRGTWFSFMEAGPGESLGSCVEDLDRMPFLAMPEHVAEEAARLWGTQPLTVPGPRYEWTPPAGYDDSPEITGDADDICLDLERSLAAYATHPAWHALQAERRS